MASNGYIKTDYLVIGSGIAGLTDALILARQGHKVAIVTKKSLYDGSTNYAQGGITFVDPNKVKENLDSYDSFKNDTLKAGDGISEEKTVDFCGHNFYKVMDFLDKEGVPFTKGENNEKYDLHQEGGHSVPRIAHAADYTGEAIQKTLVEKVKAEKNISIYENHAAIDLITLKKNTNKKVIEDVCLGAYIYDANNDKVKTFDAKATFLATGGAGRIFLFTSNSEVSTGDGIAMAYRAGAKIANMEFTQFHPTVLYGYNDNGRSYLLTEALRGKSNGAILTLDKDSTVDFVKELGYSSDGSAGTRDVVARAIDMEMKEKNTKHVWLNATSKVTKKTENQIREHYPKINALLNKYGIDMTKEAIPVVPASHYTCGGIMVDEKARVQGIRGLYALGECTYTGLMGANRLASNSLPEGPLFAFSVAKDAIIQFRNQDMELPIWDIGRATKSRDQDLVSFYWEQIRNTMWHLVGIVRNEERLSYAKELIKTYTKKIKKYYWDYSVTYDFLELRNITEIADLTINAALWRQESRGGHYRSDFPKKEDSVFKKPSIQKKEI